MRIVFQMRHPAYLRHFESTIVELTQRGHELVLVFTEPRRNEPRGPTASMCRRVEALEGVTVSDWQPRLGKRKAARDPAFAMRLWQDYLHYNDPAFGDTPKLRARSGERVPRRVRELTDALRGQPELSQILRAALRLGEQALGEDTTRVTEFLQKTRPDLVIATMLTGGARQVEVVRAARSAGIPTAFACASWDNLVTAGLLHAVPDVTGVWNGWQRDEAVTIHGIPPDTVSVTGAPVYDVWFDSRPSRDREEWCREVGLDADRPYLLYACSSSFITDDEGPYIASWLRSVRGSGHRVLDRVQLLVRPHPQNPLEISELEDIDGVVVHPRAGELPVDDESRSRYVDAIHHAAAVVGVNTSALIESAIFERGVHVHISKRYAATQTGTVHFRHLVEAGEGVLHVTQSREEHHAGLAAAVGGTTSEVTATRSQEFLTAFIRPCGFDRPATPLLADALESATRTATNGRDDGIERAAHDLRVLVEKLW